VHPWIIKTNNKFHYALHTVDQSNWYSLGMYLFWGSEMMMLLLLLKEWGGHGLITLREETDSREVCNMQLSMSMSFKLLQSAGKFGFRFWMDSSIAWYRLFFSHSSLEYWLSKCDIHSQVLTLTALHNWHSFLKSCLHTNQVVQIYTKVATFKIAHELRYEYKYVIYAFVNGE